MANYQSLKTAINAVIKANGNKEITGTVLNEILLAIVNSLGVGYQFVGVATPSTNPGTPDQNVFYLAGQAGTYTNFNNIVIYNGVSILKWNGRWSSETVLAGDYVFDISAYKATGGTLATFADLSAALDGGNNIPQSLRKGGMSVKFVQSSDNKYVQWRLMSDTFNTTVANWQGVDDEPMPDSKNLVESDGVAFSKIIKPENYIETGHSVVSNTQYTDFSSIRCTNKSGYLCVIATCTNNSVTGFNLVKTGWGGYGFGKVNKLNIYDLSIESDALTWIRPILYANSVVANGDVKFTMFTINDINILNYYLKELKHIDENISDIEGNIDDIKEVLIFKYKDTNVNVVATYDATSLANSGNLSQEAADAYQTTKVYSCSPGEKYHIFGNTIAWARRLYCIYNSSTISSENCLLKGPEVLVTTPTEYDEYVTIPEGGAYIAIAVQGTLKICKQEPVLVNEALQNIYNNGIDRKFTVTVATDSVIVSRPYTSLNKEKVNIRISKAGVNQLMQLSGISYDNEGTWYGNSSDWIGPYWMSADNNGNDNPGAFTGGFHGYNGDQTGSATARTIHVNVFLDGKSITDNGNYTCNSVSIKVINHIQAYNTKVQDGTGREVLKETVYYEFINDKLSVRLEQEALEDIHIGLYYGMQITGYSSLYQFIGKEFNIAPNSERHFGTEDEVREIIGNLSDGVTSVIASLDELCLGSYVNVSNGREKAFAQGYGTSGYSKAYYQLVKGIDLALSEGQKSLWRGTYVFKEM